MRATTAKERLQAAGVWVVLVTILIAFGLVVLAYEAAVEAVGWSQLQGRGLLIALAFVALVPLFDDRATLAARTVAALVGVLAGGAVYVLVQWLWTLLADTAPGWWLAYLGGLFAGAIGFVVAVLVIVEPDQPPVD